MTSPIIADALEQRRTLAATVLRVKPEELTAEERDLAMALLRELPVRVENGKVSLMRGAGWEPFSPMTDWKDYGEMVSNHALVVGAHELFDDPVDSDKVTGHWYSAHAYFGGTSTEGYDLREVVSETCAKLLKHDVDCANSWQLPRQDT